jgi:hypothetical protein
MYLPNDQSVQSFDDLLKTYATNAPRSIYDAGHVKIQFWQGDWQCSPMDQNRYLKLPASMNPGLKNLLRDNDDFLYDELIVTDQFVVVRLDMAMKDMGMLFAIYGIDYNKEIYAQFMRAYEEGKKNLDDFYYNSGPRRPVHPNIAILQQKLDELDGQIEAANLDTDDSDEYQAALELLRDEDGYFFERVHHLLEEIPNQGGSREEDQARTEIERRLEFLMDKRDKKLQDLE